MSRFQRNGTCSKCRGREQVVIGLLRAFSCAGLASIIAGYSFAPTAAQQNFYAGKQIALIVSSAPGGGYDAITRTVARHLGKHIPGAPNTVVQNMNGAGGIVAANHLYNIATRDGLVVAQLQNTVPFEPMYGNKQARYDPIRFNWLGSASKET